MCSKEDLNKDSSSECDLPFNLRLDDALKEKLLDIPEALDYIQKLEKIIKKYLKKINKLRKKIKGNNSKNDVEVQTDIDYNIVKNDSTESKSIVDDIKEAAEAAMQNTGFVYEETSGLYYDYNTGYYYNAEYGLYYDGTTGQYLQYNPEKQTYEFHSQTDLQLIKKSDDRNKRKKKHRKRNIKDAKRSLTDVNDQMEDGECSSSDRSSSDEGQERDSNKKGDISKSWPPCMRIIIESTEIPDLKIGSLHIITYKGGTIGREGPHAILLKDPNASKHHLRIQFNENTSNYEAIDLGSRNGTLLNGKRMSSSKQESDLHKIMHGSRIQIGQTVLLCHIHEGNQTCGHCEPGLIQINNESTNQLYKSRSDRHKKELNNLKMLYGVVGYMDQETKLGKGYTDRAQKRRETVGSQNPHEKTQIASIDESINKENKGFRMLSKMGWKEGESLGRTGDGIIEPIKAVLNEGTAGVGSTNLNLSMQTQASSQKQNMSYKMKDRFDKLPESNDIFHIDSD